MMIERFLALLLVGSCPAQAAFAQDVVDEQPVETSQSAITTEVAVVVDAFGVISGGLERDLAVLYAANFVAELDGDSIGLPGLVLHADLQLTGGDELSSELVGDAQTVDNIEAVGALRPLEVWLSYQFGASEQGTAKFGIVDLNADFDAQEVGSLFINSSHGIGPEFSQTGANGPSIFPTTTGAALVGWSEESWAVRLGAFNAVAGNPERPKRTVLALPGEDGLLMVGEVDVKLYPTLLVRLGGWHYTSEFDPLLSAPDLQPNTKNRGIYSMVELQRGGLGAWLRAGIANAEINPIESYIGGGIAQDAFGGRVGVAIAHARLGEDAMDSFRLDQITPRRAETALELTYARSVGFFSLQPNLQYIINPGWDDSIPNALVVGLRISVP